MGEAKTGLRKPVSELAHAEWVFGSQSKLFLEAQVKRLRVRAEEIPGLISAESSDQVTKSKSSSSFVQ